MRAGSENDDNIVKKEDDFVVFDGHTDIFTDVLVKRLEGETQVLEHHHLERLKKSGIEGSCAVLWIDPPYTSNYAKRLEQLLVAVKDEMDDCQGAVMVRNMADIEAAKEAGEYYILLGAEGLSAIGEDTDKLDALYDFGLRHAMLTWNEENCLASGACGNPDHGLTEAGKKMLRHMEAKHMIVDVSHLNEKSFWGVVDTVSCPIIASHSDVRALADVPRNLRDDQLKAIAESGGFVGLNAFNEFISRDRALQTSDQLIQHALYMADLIGVDHIACGFDFTDFISYETAGSFSSEVNAATEGLENCLQVPTLMEKMRQAGFSEEDVEKIAYKNWHRVIQQVLQ